MTKKMKLAESKMLDEVRGWRKAVYEADRNRSPEERAKHHAELLKRYGLEYTRPSIRQDDKEKQ